MGTGQSATLLRLMEIEHVVCCVSMYETVYHTLNHADIPYCALCDAASNGEGLHADARGGAPLDRAWWDREAACAGERNLFLTHLAIHLRVVNDGWMEDQA